MINTFIATAAAGFSWAMTEWVTRKKASLLGMASGLVAGLVAVTPAAGFAGPMGALVLGLIVSPICVFFCSVVKNALKYDDSLDAFGIHAIGGIVGAPGHGHPGQADLGRRGPRGLVYHQVRRLGIGRRPRRLWRSSPFSVMSRSRQLPAAPGVSLCRYRVASSIVWVLKILKLVDRRSCETGSRGRRHRHQRARRGGLPPVGPSEDPRRVRRCRCGDPDG